MVVDVKECRVSLVRDRGISKHRRRAESKGDATLPQITREGGAQGERGEREHGPGEWCGGGERDVTDVEDAEPVQAKQFDE